MPNNLASLIVPQPHRFHAIVENLFGNSAQLAKSFFVHTQQRADFLVQRRFRHHPSAVTQREREAPQLALLSFHLQRPQVPPIHLCLLAGRCLEASHRHRARRTALRSQPVCQNRVAAREVPLAQLAQQHPGVPYSRSQPLFQIRLKSIQLARLLRAWSVLRHHPRCQHVLANRLAIPTSQLADRLNTHPLPLQFFQFLHVAPP